MNDRIYPLKYQGEPVTLPHSSALLQFFFRKDDYCVGLVTDFPPGTQGQTHGVSKQNTGTYSVNRRDQKSHISLSMRE